MPEWLVNFRGRNRSAGADFNFLWKHGNVYLMDNHRAALWCWLQEINLRERHSIFHIDRHYDTRPSEHLLEHLPARLEQMTIEQYLDYTFRFNDGGYPVEAPFFTWDNYLSIYFATFRNSIDHAYFATHKDGAAPDFAVVEKYPWELPSNLDFWLRQMRPCIVNIDLDYFFCNEAHDKAVQMLSDAYIRRVCRVLRRCIDDGTVRVTTISLTPGTFTVGWPKAERLMGVVLDALGIDFRLP